MKKVLILIIGLCLIFSAVSATTYDYNGTIKANLGATQITTAVAAGAGAGYSVNASYDGLPVRIDYNTIGIPDFFIMYTFNDNYAKGTSTFNLYDNLGTIVGSGTFAATNGTSMYGGDNKQYYLFQFTSWSGQSKTGASDATILVPNNGVITRNGANGIFYSITAGVSGTPPIGPISAGAIGTTKPGTIYQPVAKVIDLSYEVLKVGGTGTGTISNVNVYRNSANNVATQISAIRITGALPTRYTSPFTTSTLADYFTVDGNNYVISAYAPVTALRYNSTTIFPISSSDYTFNFSVNPTSTLLGNSITGYLTSLSSTDLTAITAINIYKMGNDETNFYEAGSSTKQLNYVYRGGSWMGWDTSTNDFTNNKGAALPLSYPLNFVYAGNYTIGAYIYTGAGVLSDAPAGEVIVTNNENNPSAKAVIIFQTTDATTSQFISSPTYAIKNNLLNSWINGTGNFYDSSFTQQFSTGSQLTVFINKTGYLPTMFNTTATGNNIITTPLTPTNLFIPSTNLNWTNVQVTIKFTNDGIQYYPLSGASVSMESYDPGDAIAKTYGTTNTDGVVFFTALNQSNAHTQTYSYVITSVIPNYKIVSKSIIPTGNLYTVSLWTQANQIINPTGQPTIIPITTIPTATSVPVITPSAWGGNGITGGNGSVCAPITGSTTMLESFKINLACNGVTGGQAQSLTLAGLICLVFILAGSRYGKGMGAAFGGIVGFVLSLAMGFIPFWVFAALIILCGLAAAIIAIRGST